MKKIMCFTISLALILSLNSTAFAAETAVAPCGDSMTDSPISIEEQEASILNDVNISENQKALFLQKFKDYKKMKSGNKGISPMVANTKSGFLSVPYFEQETGYYCGPATTKQTIEYINGASQSQSTIASAIGTTKDGSNLTDMKNYINREQGRHAYIIVTSPSEDLIQNIVEYSVRNGAPTVARLKIAKGGNWAYTTSGHYMNLTGFKNYGANIRVTDPYIGWIQSSSSGSYYVTSNEIYTATINHKSKQMMY